jgi:hypothetical protein
MSVSLKIGFNNNLITNSSYTKFLGVTMDNTLFWNNRVDLLMKKLSTACYIIRNAKTYMSASSFGFKSLVVSLRTTRFNIQILYMLIALR